VTEWTKPKRRDRRMYRYGKITGSTYFQNYVRPTRCNN